MPPDYSNTYIYKLFCKDPSVTEIYVGSTTNFSSRKKQHRRACCNNQDKGYSTPVYKFIRDHGDWANWDIVLIATVSATDRQGACKVERQYVEGLNAALNSKIPSRTTAQWRADNAEHVKEYRRANEEKIKDNKKQWRQDNKDKINEQKRQYRARKREEQRNSDL